MIKSLNYITIFNDLYKFRAIMRMYICPLLCSSILAQVYLK